jgi:ABC-type nickel/cobalt efflux system permease component RcnA
VKRQSIVLVNLVLSVLLMGLLLGPAAAIAQNIRSITWGDLQAQASMDFDDPFAELSEEQLYDVAQIARYRELRQQGKTGSDVPSETELGILADLEAQDIDVDWLLSQRERVKQARRQQVSAPSALSGEQVEISGYVLPLTQQRQRTTEFLLVPWVGACIHTPPPPANQMIHVDFPTGMAIPERFTPVTLTGLLENSLERHRLYLVDGSRDVEVAYGITAATVTAYVPGDSDPLAQVTIPDAALAEQHFWQRWQTQVSTLFTNTMVKIQGQPMSGAFLIGVLVAFGYGVLHTLGPGHGKAVIVSYFIGEGGSLQRGLGMGIRIAVCHVFAAVVLAIATQLVVQQVGGSEASSFRTMRLLSYGAIAGIGGWMVWQTLQAYRRPHQPTVAAAPDSGKAIADRTLYPSLSQAVLERPAPMTEREQTGWGCRCLNCFSSTHTGGWLSVAIGAVPCSGALIVVLYGLANNMVGISIALVMAISVGMAIALSTIGILALLGRQTLDRRLMSSARQRKISAGLRLAGAAMVCTVGGGLFLITLLPIA